MMLIMLNELLPTEEWRKAANVAKAEVENASAAERSKKINAHQSVWKDLKEKLRLLSFEKCWYCESIDDRSDNAVDHFRPKGNVKDVDPPHDGYWWLAFDETNYRFSCTYCNSIRKGAEGESGGKQDYFPLVDENYRARSKKDNLDNEYPQLLDPISKSDIDLLAFTDDGRAGPAVPEDEAVSYERVKVSVRRYHLNHPNIAERRAAKMRQVKKWVEDADRHLDRFSRYPLDTYAKKNYDARANDIFAAVQRKAEFSAAARYAVAGMAATSEVAQKFTRGFD